MKKLQFSIFLSLLAYATSPFSDGAPQIAQQYIPTLWHGLYPLGDEKHQHHKKVEQSFFELSSLFEVMDAWRSSMYLPQSQQLLWQEFREDIQSNSTNELLQLNRPYKKNLKDGTSSLITFNGNWSSLDQSPINTFEFSILNTQRNTEINNRARSTTKMGSVIGQVKLSKGSLTENNTRIDFSSTMALETMMFTEMLKSIESINKLFEQDHINHKSSSIKVEPPKQSVATSIQSLTEFENKLLANIYSSLPNLMSTLTSFTHYKRIASPALSPEGKKITIIELEQEINLDNFKEEFPDTFNDFEDLLTSVSTKTEILTQDNLRIGTVNYNATTHVFSVNIALSNGGFILQDRLGTLSDTIIYPSLLNVLEYKIKTDATVSIYGLDIEIENIIIDGYYHSGLSSSRAVDNPRQLNQQTSIATPRLNRTASLKMKASTIPKVDVHGAFLYFIPYWLIDLLIPGTLETLIAEAFEDVVTGNNGEGFNFDLALKEQNNSHSVSVNTSIEMPHKLLQAILKIEEPEHTQQPRLYQTLRRNIREDFANTAARFNDPRTASYLSEYIDE